MSFDSFGWTGLIIDYAIIVLFSGSALILFCYFWKKGKLNFEESIKFQMFEDENERK